MAYDWDALQFDESILPADPPRYNVPRQLRIQFVVVHHMTVLGVGNGSALDTCVNIWRTREASAHYGVDGALVRQFVYDDWAAWATADWNGNHAGISIEHANSAVGDASGWPVAEVTWKTGARLAAYLHKHYDLGRPWSNADGSDGTLRQHGSFFATGCPGPFLRSIWSEYVTEAARVYDQIMAGQAPDMVLEPAPAPGEAPAAPAPAPAPTPSGVYHSGLSWIVEPGDTLAGIAAYYGIPERLADICELNAIGDPNVIQVGQSIAIPGPLFWTVDPGDTLGAIAAHYGMEPETVAANNGIADINQISVGQVLRIAG